MDQRLIHRRGLCKTIVALMIAAISSPLKKLGAQEQLPKPDSNVLAKEKQKSKPEGLLCILRRRSPDNCVTFLRGHGTAKQGAGKDNGSGKGWLD